MPLYIAVGPDGRQHRLSVVAASDVLPLEADEQLVTDAARDAEPVGMAWDAATLAYVPVSAPVLAPATSPTMSRGDWLDRIGFDGKVTLHALRIDPATPVATRALLETLHAEILIRAEVDVRHNSTQSAAVAVTDLLIATGKVTQADRSTHIAMMLAEQVLTDG